MEVYQSSLEKLVIVFNIFLEVKIKDITFWDRNKVWMIFRQQYTNKYIKMH